MARPQRHIGPKHARTTTAKPNLGKSLEVSNVDEELRKEDPPVIEPTAGVNYEEPPKPENQTPESQPPQPQVDPLAGCSHPSRFTNRFRIEGQEQTVRLVLAEASGDETHVSGVFMFSLADFARLSTSCNQIIQAYRVREAPPAPAAEPTEEKPNATA